MNPELNFEKRYRLVREVIETVVLTVLMFLIIRLAVQNFNIDGHSMEPTLHNAELILVDKWTYLFHAPARGDIIVFVAPPNPSQDYIKRVIGLPGDVITIQGTTVMVNGQAIKEFYVDPHNQENPYPSFTNRVIPQGAYFVLGDNRGGSSDSREWGCLPRQNIIGRAALVYWPLGQNNNGLLSDVSSVFSPVPGSVSVQRASTMCPIITAPRASAHTSPLPDETMNTMLLLVMPSMLVVCTRRRRIVT